MNTSDFKDLIVWNKSMDIVVDIYSFIKSLPPEERFCLGDQIRRSSVSIPSNIAEGHNRNSNKDFIRFLSISRGSVAELQTQLILCKRIGFLSEEGLNIFNQRLIEIDKMLASLMRTLYRELDRLKKEAETSRLKPEA